MKRVLIVDDAGPMRKVLAMMLRRHGFDSVEASNALEAMAQLRGGGSFSLALVDWNLPGVNGIELIKGIRGQAHYANLPILMTTAINEQDHRAHALAVGANEYLMKPLTAEGLRDKLDKLGLLERRLHQVG